MQDSVNVSCKFGGEILLPKCKGLNDSIFSETVISLTKALTKAAYVTELARDQAPYLLLAGQADSYLAGKKTKETTAKQPTF